MPKNKQMNIGDVVISMVFKKYIGVEFFSAKELDIRHSNDKKLSSDSPTVL